MTQVWQKYKNYFSILILLLVVKYIWFPLWQGKQEKWIKLHFTEASIAKAESLLVFQDEMELVAQQVSALLADAENKLGKTSDITRYKVQTQQQLEQFFLDNNLQIDLSSWRDGVETQGVQTLVLDLRFSGQLKNFLNLLYQLQNTTDMPAIGIHEQQLTMRSQTATSMGQVDGSISFKLAVVQEVGE